MRGSCRARVTLNLLTTLHRCAPPFHIVFNGWGFPVIILCIVTRGSLSALSYFCRLHGDGAHVPWCNTKMIGARIQGAAWMGWGIVPGESLALWFFFPGGYWQFFLVHTLEYCRWFYKISLYIYIVNFANMKWQKLLWPFAPIVL